ncbi:hypothetical protein DMB38_01320 [Streptomyces sp. WAC 06738]|nr:hypothetical protein DMB38_01320 [Streptomyces sp. WAC 06738]
MVVTGWSVRPGATTLHLAVQGQPVDAASEQATGLIPLDPGLQQSRRSALHAAAGRRWTSGRVSRRRTAPCRRARPCPWSSAARPSSCPRP